MDTEFLYIISVISFLLLVFKLIQTKKLDEIDLVISDYTIHGIFILVMLFTDNVKLLFALIFITLPYCSLGFYLRNNKDKKLTMVSFSIFAVILIVFWTAAP